MSPLHHTLSKFVEFNEAVSELLKIKWGTEALRHANIYITFNVCFWSTRSAARDDDDEEEQSAGGSGPFSGPFGVLQVTHQTKNVYCRRSFVAQQKDEVEAIYAAHKI